MVLTFFIAGLLYLLCLEHVDNLGAYSIPSETGLLIPSVNNNHFRVARHPPTTEFRTPWHEPLSLPVYLALRSGMQQPECRYADCTRLLFRCRFREHLSGVSSVRSIVK